MAPQALALASTLVATVALAACHLGEVSSAHDTLDGSPLSQQTVRLGAGGAVRIGDADPVLLADPDYERPLAEVLSPIAASMPWQAAFEERPGGQALPSGWLRLELAPEASFADLWKLLERANRKDLGFFKFALVLEGEQPSDREPHYVILPKDLSSSWCPADGAFPAYAVEIAPDGKPLYHLGSYSEPESEFEAAFTERSLEQLLATKVDLSPEDLEFARWGVRFARNVPASLVLDTLAGLVQPGEASGLTALDARDRWPVVSSDRGRSHLSAFVFANAELEDENFLTRYESDWPDELGIGPQCAHHLAKGEGTLIAYRHYSGRRDDAPGTGLYEKLSIHLPDSEYKPGTYSIEPGGAAAVLSFGSYVWPETSFFGSAITGTITLSPGERQVLVTCALEVPLQRMNMRSRDFVDQDTVHRTWSFLAERRTFQGASPWLGAHVEFGAGETTPLR